MRPLSGVERFFERLFERPSARLFRLAPRPVQLQRRIERSMEHGRRHGRGSTAVPDRFTVRVSPADLATIGDDPNLPVLLASSALAFARTHGYAVAARPRVAIVADRALSAGDIEVEARFSSLGTGQDVGGREGDLAQTQAFMIPTIQSPQVTLSIVEPGRPARTLVADGRAVLIGRGSECGIVLADQRASREHARLQARDGVLVLTDLGSTNGTWLHGSRVAEAAIGVGDRIAIGESTITVLALDDEAATAGHLGRSTDSPGSLGA